jgi:hypothetical protein
VRLRAVAVGLSVVGLLGCADERRESVDDRLAAGFERVQDPSVWVTLERPIVRYFHFRKRAVVERDMEVLWREYPSLRRRTRDVFVNAERDWLEFFPPLIDGNLDPNLGGDNMRIRRRGRLVDVFVHGWETYVMKDFSQTGGELLMVITLAPDPRRRYTVVRTREIGEAEYHEALDRSSGD